MNPKALIKKEDIEVLWKTQKEIALILGGENCTEQCHHSKNLCVFSNQTSKSDSLCKNAMYGSIEQYILSNTQS